MAIAVQATEPKKAVQRAVPDRAKPAEAPPQNDFEDALEQAARKEEPAPADKPKPTKKPTKAEKPKDAAPTDEAAVTDESPASDETAAAVDPEATEEPISDEADVPADLPPDSDRQPTAILVVDPLQFIELSVTPIAAPINPTPGQAAQDAGCATDETVEPTALPSNAISKASSSTTTTAEVPVPDAPIEQDVAATDTADSETSSIPKTHAHPKPTVTPLDDSPPSVPQPALKPAKESTDQLASAESVIRSLESIPTTGAPAPIESSQGPEKLAPELTTAPVSDSPKPQLAPTPVAKSAPLPDATPPELRFATDNHDRIVTNVRTQLLPGGGSMQIRLDPPELGALKVMVEMRDGVMTATFQTSSDEATRLLSHSLNQLKHVLEGQGVSIERLQVQQAPKNEQSRAGDEQNQQQQSWSDEHAAKQEQQRKELLRRAWRKASGLGDPIDFMA